MLGDINFYESGGSLFDRMISTFTKSPFVHVAIDIGNNQMIEALNSGIVKSVYREPGAKFLLKVSSTNYDPTDLNNAYIWLMTMVGKKYGWSDIGTAINGFNKFLYIVAPHYYDCSALATEFLIRAGGVELGDLGDDPHLATPGSLARQLGVQ